MKPLEFEDGAIQVDATIVAAGLEITPTALLERLRQGTVTSLCERGVDVDSGRYRLTFFSERRRFRLIADEAGAILQQTGTNFGQGWRPLPRRKPDGGGF
jgi:hypothetical protein|tara:strand:- start:595 stop:894 length:300 start_codon:yes stop_codon:yes gene_type:complete